MRTKERRIESLKTMIAELRKEGLNKFARVKEELLKEELRK